MTFSLGLKKSKRNSAVGSHANNGSRAQDRRSIGSAGSNSTRQPTIMEQDHHAQSPALSGISTPLRGRPSSSSQHGSAHISELPLIHMDSKDTEDLEDSNSLHKRALSRSKTPISFARVHANKHRHTPDNHSFLNFKKIHTQDEEHSQNESSSYHPSGEQSYRGDTDSQHSSKKPTLSSPHQVEEHMANVESTANSSKNNSGFFSTLVHAAQNAASQLISSQNADDLKSHPPKQGPSEPEMIHSDSFTQHLEVLLHKEHSGRSSGHENQAQNDELEIEHDPAPSLARDVQFKPLRKTILGTLGKGELSLKDLGFDEGSANTNVNGNLQPTNTERPLSLKTNTPQIKITENTPTETTAAKALLSPETNSATDDNFSKSLDEETRAEDNSKANILPTTSFDSNVSTAGSGDTPNGFKSLERRAISPINSFRRSFSPGGLKQGPAKFPNRDQSFKRVHSKSIGSANGDISINGNSTPVKNNFGLEITSAASETNSSSDLKSISFASAKRNTEFHNLFKSIPKSERLIDDYNCALQKEILVQGKIYVSEFHLSFKSNILGWVTNLTIPIEEVVQVEKKTTAGLFHNAIVVRTLHKKYVFASFLQRDTTFELIVGIWSQLVRGSLGRDSNTNLNIELEDLSRQQTYDSYDSDSYDEDDDYDEEEEDDEEEREENDNGSNAFESDHEANAQASLDENTPTRHEPTEPKHQEHANETKITEKFIDLPLPKTYQMLFGDDTSTLREIIQKQKNYDVSTLTGFKEENGVKSRYYEYTKPLSAPVGPKATLCKVTETLDHYDLNDYVKVIQSTKSPDVPSGNAFVVNTLIYLSWGSNNSTKITVYTYIDWTGKSWIKAAVEKGTVSGQNEAIGVLVDELIRASKSNSGSEKNVFENESSDEESESLPTVGPKTHAPTRIDHEMKSSETMVIDEVVNAPLGTIYSIMFGDDTSYAKSIIAAQKNINISEIPAFKSEGAIKKRNYNYTKPLSGPIGPKKTKCFITETIEHFDLDKYIQINQTTSSPDVPSGNSFSVVSSIYLSWAENNNTRIYVLTEIVWTGRSWIKSAIEKGTLDGQKESYSILLTEIRNILKNATAGGKKKRKRAKTRTSSLATRKASEEGTKQEISQVQPELSLQGVVDLVLKQLSHPLSAIGLLCVTFLMFYLTFKAGCLVFGSPTQHVRIDHVNRVDINGQRYMLVPSLDDVLQSESVRKKAEFDIWNWIDDRKTKDVQEPSKFRAKSHSDQDLVEMLKLAEQHLSILRGELNASVIN